jgi:hypothetical protein
VLKTDYLDKKVRRGLVVAFAETVKIDNGSITSEELWDWVSNVCQYCLYNSSEGLCTHQEHTLEVSEGQLQSTDEEKHKWIRECHDSPIAGHPGRAKTYDLLSRSRTWNGMRKDVDHYVRNCHTCQ